MKLLKHLQFKHLFPFLLIFLFRVNSSLLAGNDELTIGEGGYFEMPGLNVLVYNNTFAEGHQSGVEIIMHGNRVATNGDLRLSPSPGQWQPLPRADRRVLDLDGNQFHRIPQLWPFLQE